MDVKTLHVKEISDIHLGHVNTPTVEILDNLYKAFPNDASFDCDILFIAGDFFDRLLHVPDDNVTRIKIWINYFLRLCKKYDVVLRVLEGTPSHDWGQSKLFETINDIAEIEADVKYFDGLDIEYIERFGIHVLYIRDEYHPETDDTWMDVQKKLNEHGIEQVDFSIMHGAFDYQLPSHIEAPTHNPQRYLDITRYFVFIGHVHTHSIFERIIAAGSFDRLTQGEEEPKGYMDVVVRQSGEHDVVFVENKDAKYYKTINCSGMDLDKALRYVDKEMKTMRDHSFVRIQANKTDAILVNMEVLRKKYPMIHFSTKVGKEIEISTEALIDMKQSYQPIAITRANITKLLIDRLKNKGLEAEKLTRAEELLNDYIG